MSDLEPLLLRGYADAWYARRRAEWRPRTQRFYRWALDREILPILGDVALLCLTRRLILEFLAHLRERALAGKTITGVKAVLCVLLNDAVDVGVLPANPVAGIRVKGAKPAPRRVYTEAEVACFLTTARRLTPGRAPLFSACVRAGLRVGEARALRPEDVDLAGRRLRVCRAAGWAGHVGPPKNGLERVVDVSAELGRDLAPLLVEPTEWLFPGIYGPLSDTAVRETMARIIEAAALPRATPHSLRHAFASTLLTRGVNVDYVRRALGHATAALTIDLYGSHFPLPRPAVLDEL
jgi:integrase